MCIISCYLVCIFLPKKFPLNPIKLTISILYCVKWERNLGVFFSEKIFLDFFLPNPRILMSNFGITLHKSREINKKRNKSGSLGTLLVSFFVYYLDSGHFLLLKNKFCLIHLLTRSL